MLLHQLISRGTDDCIAFHGKETVAYGRFRAEVAAYRAFLHHAGVKAGDNVGLISRNAAEFVYAYMAVVSLGAVVVPLNFQLTAREIAYIINDARIRHLITAETLSLGAELDRCGYQGELAQYAIPALKARLAAETFPPAPDIDATLGEDSPCVIIYTSGTTGNPKGAVLTHGNLVSNAAAFREALPIDAADNVLCVLPMYHCFAWTCAVLNPLLCGASITVLDGFTPKETIAAVKQHGVTVMYGVPPMYNLLARAGEADDLAGIRFFVSGGAPLPEKIARQFREKYGRPIIEGYGLSEASPVVTLNPPDKTKYYSIGKPLPGLEVRIAGPKGEPVAPGTVGEIIVKGPSVMQGYHNLPLETSVALRDGWLHTGDLAYRDTEWYFYIVDRLKDLIIANGENVYPREIEELLYAYPGVAEAAVIGVPDELRGQAVRAYLVLADGHTLDKKAVRDYLAANLAAYKLPRDYIVLDALPKNQTGKILKRVLRDQVAAGTAEQVG
ncbi:class I adenylate-forming enzyme family protein [Anaeroselena agilis]|uniref:Long-chain fatty acid--CoA ligase n=1 Tax=Anaeroselena agilis TaxID=3063788 RepID=A0ABU3P4R0_9FIRM|nr:long-chain fatty acid--CoA ligase [Selenomonadales bacterium 4137-cl]